MSQVPLSIIFRYPLFYEGQFSYPTFWVVNLISEQFDIEVMPIACIINPLVIWLRGPLRLSKLFTFFKSLCDPEKFDEFFPSDDFRDYFLFVTKSATAMFLPLSTVIDNYGDYDFDVDDGKQYTVVSPSKTTKSENIIKVEDVASIVINLYDSELKKGLEHLIKNGSQTPINLYRLLNHKYEFFRIMHISNDRLKDAVKCHLPERTISLTDYLPTKITRKDKMNLEEKIALKLGETKDKKSVLSHKRSYKGPHPDNFTFESLDQQGKAIGDYCNWKRQHPEVEQDDPELIGAVYWQRYGKLCNVRVFCVFRHLSGHFFDTWIFYRDLLILKQDPNTILIMKHLTSDLRNSEPTTKEEEILNRIELIISNEIHIPQQNLLQGLETSNESAQTLIQQYHEIRYQLNSLMPIYPVVKPFYPKEYFPLPIERAQKIPFVSLPMFDNK